MKAVIQRVRQARVEVAGELISEIGPGILTLLGIEKRDALGDAEKLIQKILKLRIFEDDQGKMNLSLLDRQGSHLIVSQFTLLADTSRGNRPSFIDAAPPDMARELYERAIEISSKTGIQTAGGRFQADMRVQLVNDGPVTLILQS